MGFFKVFIRFFVIIFLMVVVGQVPFKGKTLENHYHEYVNTVEFKKNYKKFIYVFARPFVWGAKKLEDSYPKDYDPYEKKPASEGDEDPSIEKKDSL